MLNKKILGVVAVALSAIAINAQAATEGVYVGGQLGVANVHTEGLNAAYTDLNTVATSSSSSNKTTGLAGRVFAGYQFNPNWAAEFGWTKFNNANTKAAADLNVQNILFVNQTLSAQFKTDALDLVAKGMLPVSNNVSLYAKLGVAYVIQRMEFKDTASAAIATVRSTETAVYTQSARKLLPTAGVGVSYAFNDKLSADLGYSRIQKVGNTAIRSTDFVGLGLTYSIG